jgi:hypothetical protein
VFTEVTAGVWRQPIGTPPRHARSSGVELSTDTQIKLPIGYALSDRLVPIACTIVETIQRMIGLIDELPAVAVEALLDHVKEQHRLDQPRTGQERAFRDIRAAYIKYGEITLHEARERNQHTPSGPKGPRAKSTGGPAGGKGSIGMHWGGTETPCAVGSAHSNVQSPSPPFGQLGPQRV